MKKAFDFFTEHPARFFFLAAIITFFILWYVNANKDPEGFSWHDVIVESHGVLFDLIVFGILLSVYEGLKAKNDRIRRYKEEIHDFRGHKSELIAYRNAGIIKRLNKQEGEKILDLKRCWLSGANLSGIELLPGSDLSGGTFNETDLTDAILEGVDLHSANLLNAILFNTNLTNANLEDVQVEENWFDLLETYQVKGRNQIKQTYFPPAKNAYGQFLLKKITP